MCGIVAIFKRNNRVCGEKLIREMNNKIIHRGPDDEGYHNDTWFNLGFRRLSIIDTSLNGHQPMYDETGRYIIVYNGELYNYREIKKQLIKKGYTFRSESDTEVVLKSYIEWGIKCLDKFVGMFGMIIVDNTKAEAVVVRDHMGIKPLYIYQDKNCVLVASELKAFNAYSTYDLNLDSLYEHFLFRYVSGTNTLFKNIQRLEPGHYLKISFSGTVEKSKYYDVADSLYKSPRLNINYEEVREKLEESMLMHTVSDVGYNIQLSGGLDSSYITAVLASMGQQLRTYSIEVPEYEKNESEYQKIVSAKYNTTHYPIKINSKDYCSNLEKMTWHLETPIVHGADVLLMHLCSIANKTSKVILTGEGADELFGGYGRYKISKKLKFIFNTKKYLSKYLSGESFILRHLGLKDIELGLDEQVYLKKAIVQSLLKDRIGNYEFRKVYFDKFPDLTRKIIVADQTSYLSSLLERQDKLSMANSVETRVPYVTHILFDLVNSYDYNDKINPYPKKILKTISEKYFDQSFIHRPKIGFLLPYKSWLMEPKGLGRYVDLLRSKSFIELGYFDNILISKKIDEHRKSIHDNSKLLMMLIFFEVWRKQYIENK